MQLAVRRMNKIGIMQGRVLPERLDQLQIFPVSNWKNELIKIKGMGFNCVELLFDKELILETLLADVDDVKSLGIKRNNKNNGLTAQSICVDYLSLVSVLNPETEVLFYDKIIKLIETISNTTINTLVTPFFDANSITSESDLHFVLEWIEERNLDEITSEGNIILALELTLPALQIRSAFIKHSFNNVAICYDLGNARAAGYSPEEEIIMLNDLIAHVHIKDRKVNGPNVMLGEGDVDFVACFKSLKEIGYDGQLILETAYETSPAAEAKKNLQFIQNIIAGISS